MSSNIGPEASAAYDRYLDAKLIDEKINLQGLKTCAYFLGKERCGLRFGEF